MAKIQEPDENVEEKASMHSKKAQFTVLGIMVVLMVLVLINALIRSNSSSSLMGDNDKDNGIVENTESPQSRMSSFEQRLNRAERELNQTQKESYEDMLARREREANVPINSPKSEAVVGGQAVVDDWHEKERERVRQSRYDNYELNLGFKSKNALSQLRGGQNNSLRGIGGIAPNGSVSDKLKGVNEEIARVQALQAQLAQGNVPDNLMGSASTPQAPSPESFNFQKQRLVGNAVSKQPTPKEGQALLSIGSVLDAVLDQKVMSDYEGSFRLRIARDVYDVSNRYVLIPAGSIASCRSLRVANVNEPIQARMGYLIDKVVLPDGKYIDFSRQVGFDRQGVSAVKDEVDRHLFAQFMGVAAYAIVSSETSRNGTGFNNDSTFGSDVGRGMRTQVAPLAQKYLQLVPTITLNAGLPVKIYIEEELYIYPWSAINDAYTR